ncbi:MAG TPA: sigma-70 family RNA polymerase sigma factor [Chloroflexota bacterium]|nr:sigma-70 family RNA polymerase sigma factor [Chloroflexota bacterium]
MALHAKDWVKPREVPSDDAFDRLFVSEYQRVVGIAFRLLGDRSAAEDVAQEVFISFHSRYDPLAPFAGAWLHKAASHRALNVIRDGQRRQRREQAGDPASPLRGEASTGPGMSPEHAATQDEDRREVRETLARLPKRSALVLALRYSGLSYAEVAAALGCRVGQVGTLLRRAEEAFRKEYRIETRS